MVYWEPVRHNYIIIHIIIKGFWCSACLICILLGFNRCLDFVDPITQEKLFDGYKTWLWLILPFLYFLWVFIFETPVIFDWYYGAWWVFFALNFFLFK